jgi:DNA-binding transcriptional MerR regulator
LPTTSEFLTTSATARELGRSEHTVREYDRTGVLPAVRASNGNRLFARSDIDALKRCWAAQEQPTGDHR